MLIHSQCMWGCLASRYRHHLGFLMFQRSSIRRLLGLKAFCFIIFSLGVCFDCLWCWFVDEAVEFFCFCFWCCVNGIECA